MRRCRLSGQQHRAGQGRLLAKTAGSPVSLHRKKPLLLSLCSCIRSSGRRLFSLFFQQVLPCPDADSCRDTRMRCPCPALNTGRQTACPSSGYDDQFAGSHTLSELDTTLWERCDALRPIPVPPRKARRRFPARVCTHKAVPLCPTSAFRLRAHAPHSPDLSPGPFNDSSKNSSFERPSYQLPSRKYPCLHMKLS